MPPAYHYVIVRSDLTVGQQAAHILHAAAQSSHGLHDDATHAVVLTVPDAATLQLYWGRLLSAGIKSERVEDYAIGIVPTRDRKPIRKITSSLPLLRESQGVCIPGVKTGDTASLSAQSQDSHQCTPSVANTPS